jgi:hypothetical protein
LKFINSSLEHFEMKGGFLCVLNVSIVGWHTLRYLDLSYNIIEFMAPNILLNMDALTTLILAGNKLHHMETVHEFSDLFVENRALQHIVLAHNGLRVLPAAIFRGNSLLKTVDLSGNMFTTFDLDLSMLPLVQWIDMSTNRLPSVSSIGIGIIEGTNMHANNTSNTTTTTNSLFTIDLRNNTFECTCSTREFVRWVRQTSTRLYRKENYMCTRGGKEELLTSVSFDDVECTSRSPWIPAMSVVVALVLIVQGLWTVLYIRRKCRRRRWKARIQLAIQKYREEQHERKKYLVFLAYSSTDSQLVVESIYPSLERKLREKADVNGDLILINGKHFIPGVPIDDEVVRAVYSSHVIVLFVSSAFLKSGWCMFESYCAFGERKPIILFFGEKVNKRNMPPFLRHICDKRVRAMWPEDGSDEAKDEVLDSVCASVIRAYTLLNHDGDDGSVASLDNPFES